MDRERKIRRWGDNVLTESELYKELGILTKEKERWKANVPYVACFGKWVQSDECDKLYE